MMATTLNIPLGEQPHLKEMFSMLENHHMEAQAQNMEDFLQYFNQMEQYFGDMQSELVYLRKQLDQLNDKTLKAKIENFINTVGNRTDTAKIWLSAVKKDVSVGVKMAVERAKYHGGQALYMIINKTKMERALSIINEHLKFSAESLEHSAQTIGDIGYELNAAKGHKKNVRNLLMGKEAVDTFEYDHDKGIAKIRKAIEFCGKIIKGMLGHTENIQKSLDNFSQKAIDSKAKRTEKESSSAEKTAGAVHHGKVR